MHGPAATGLPRGGETRDSLVAVVRQCHDRSRGQLIENRRDPRHAGGERDRRATFKAADDISSSASQPGVPSSREYARRSPGTKFDAGHGGTFIAVNPGGGPVLPRPATIRLHLDHWRCTLRYSLMSLVDFSGCPSHQARSSSEPLWTVGSLGYARLLGVWQPSTLKERYRQISVATTGRCR